MTTVRKHRKLRPYETRTPLSLRDPSKIRIGGTPLQAMPLEKKSSRLKSPYLTEAELSCGTVAVEVLSYDYRHNYSVPPSVGQMDLTLVQVVNETKPRLISSVRLTKRPGFE